MKISGIDNLDVGMSNIEIEGEVVYTDVPQHRISPPDAKKPYDFWSQWIVIEDETGKIGCSISIEKEEYKLDKGIIARVKGKLAEWQGKRKIEGKLIAISKGDKVTDVQQEAAEEYFEEKAKIDRLANEVGKELKPITAEVPTIVPTKKPKGNNNGYQDKENYWQDKHEWDKYTWKFNRAGMSRSNGVNYAKDMIDILLKHKIIEPKENEVMTYFWGLTGEFGKYIFNGEKPDNGKPKEKSILRNREPLEIIDEDAPFPDEEREEVEKAVDKIEEENSFHKAIPYTGKKKALKPVSKAEDFISQSDMPD